jgi:divalent metal cation (Fe/Co/Zn/Cd) transporter
VASALRLLLLTVGWNGIVGATALVAAFVAGSLALAGFALNALVDSCASAVLIWRFRRERRDPAAAERLEERAQVLIVLAMFGSAAYIGFQAVRALIAMDHPERSAFGAVLAAASLLVLPLLGRAKLRRAAQLSSNALRGDALLTVAAAALAATALAALGLNAALGWWWADRCAALVIAAALAAEASRVARRRLARGG